MSLAVVYRFNKHYQINGSLFYSFEYFLKLLEEKILKDKKVKTLEELSLLNKETNQNITKEYLKDIINNLSMYIIIPTKFKKNYLINLEVLFRTKYILWYKEYFRDRKLFDIAKQVLTEEEYNLLLLKNKLLIFAFKQIKLLTQIEFTRKKQDKLLFCNFDSFEEIKDSITTKDIYILQNRKVSDTFKEKDLEKYIDQNKDKKFNFYYELQDQKFEFNLPNFIEYQYNLRLDVSYMVPKKLFRVSKYPPTQKIISGNPLNTSQMLLYSKYKKPTVFAQLNKEVQLADPIFFLNTRLIEYHKNTIFFDENNRLIPEGRYYGIPINLINPDLMQHDSISNRYTNDLSDYILTNSDIIIKILT